MKTISPKPLTQLPLAGIGDDMSHKADADADESVRKTKVGQKGQSSHTRIRALEESVVFMIDLLLIDAGPSARAALSALRATVSGDSYDTGWYTPAEKDENA